MNIELILEIFLMLGIVLLMWYFTCKYLLSTGVSSRDDETMPIFIGGIILFIVVAVIIYLVMGVVTCIK
jgi:hypothetical protein